MTDSPKHKASSPVSRRRVVIGGSTAAAAAGLGLAGLASAATTDSTTADASATTSATATATSSTGVCSLTSEVTEGPYSLAGALVRRDIREGKEGVEVKYTFCVVDEANGCAPLADALVELWHCDALGEYSGFVGKNGHTEDDDSTFLRGGYTTDSDGKVHITSIWPGHYVSRAVHVHMRVHTGVTLADGTYTGGNICHTGQLFFDPDINAKIQAAAPYSANTTAETLLADDSVYDDAGAISGLLTLKPQGKNASHGYSASLTVGVDSTATSGGGGGTPPTGEPPTGAPPTDTPSVSASS
ncbi:intradiol ring-cleavage dioxygenase [Actinacidiphila oryziradicis]|uniref:intradiol ring-cleavage dioxygenase n=1 Tax=Actinacidiphila oryziradicis TaxID=2571141 RepID=UPI0023F4688F|nr:intradiol ring-cleavage dioxygenase [Actinacidiphila oryziradicis]MCW2871509.1 putative protocatechuate dioxygenase [Actinacidiphila oryziradicis]